MTFGLNTEKYRICPATPTQSAIQFAVAVDSSAAGFQSCPMPLFDADHEVIGLATVEALDVHPARTA
jgi:hypothetical protein